MILIFISKQESILGFFLLLIGIIISLFSPAYSRCSSTCDLALGSYYVWQGSNLTFISQITQNSIQNILTYNPQIPNQDTVLADTRINIPFSCDCIRNEFLGHVFSYDVNTGDTYDRVAGTYYSNLTTGQSLAQFNSYSPNFIPDTATLNVTVNCSCGDEEVSRDYGLFVTYPLRPGENLISVAAANNLSSDLVRSYNPRVNFSAGSGLVFIPGRGEFFLL